MYNNSYMKMGRNKRIVHFISNGAMIDNLSEHVEYVTKLRKIAEISMTNACDHCVLVTNEFDYDTLKHNLKSVSQMNFELAVIWFEGSWPLTGEFEENLLSTYDNEWSKTSWLASGHIIDKRPDTEMPGFDPQCVVINLKEYQSLEYPNLVARKREFSPMYECSEQHVHDDYTPMYLKPTDNFSKSKETGEGCLDALIHIALKNGMYIHNFPYSIRDEKYCCYPEDDIEETKEWFLDTNFSSNTKEEIIRISENISEDKEELFGYKYMDKIVLYITNTESVPPKGQIVYSHNVMTCPASGLHQFMHMINARETLEKVIWTDFSEAALWWVEFLITNWDGTDFIGFYQANKQYIHDVYGIDDATITYDEELVNSFMEEVGDTWLSDWAQIQSLNHTYMKLNMVTEWDKLVNALGTDNNVFLQVSNIWQYEINYVNTKNCQAQLAYINLISEVMHNNKELFVTGDTPSGVYYSYQNMKEIASIV